MAGGGCGTKGFVSRIPIPTEPAYVEDTLCIFWDVEATGPEVLEDEITEIGCVAQVFGRDLEWLETGMHFHSYVLTTRQIPPRVEKLTGISNSLLSKKGVHFEKVICQLESWIGDLKAAYQKAGERLWFVAHSGTRFDMPILFSQEKRRGMKAGAAFRSFGCTATVDSYLMARRLKIDGSLKLANLHESTTGRIMEREHSALCDAIALADIMKHDPFLLEWKTQPVAYSLRSYMEHNHWRWDSNRSRD